MCQSSHPTRDIADVFLGDFILVGPLVSGLASRVAFAVPLMLESLACPLHPSEPLSWSFIIS